MNRYRRLLPYTLRQWPALLAIGALTLLSSAMTALQPWPLKVLVDHALKNNAVPGPLQSFIDSIGATSTPATLITIAALASIAVFLLNSLFHVSLTWGWTIAGQRMVRHLALDLFQRLQRISLRFHQHHPVGDLLGRLTTDTWCVYKLTDGILISPVQKLVTLAALGAVAWHLHAGLAACALATAPLVAVATVHFGKRIRERARLGREAQSRLLSFIHQTLSSVPIVQAFSSETRNQQHFQDLAQDTVTLSQKRTLTTSYYALATGLITTAGTALIVFLGAREVMAGRLTLGSFIVFTAYMRTLQSTAEGLVKLYGTLKPTEASIDRVIEILDATDDSVTEAPNAPPLPTPTPRNQGRVRFDNVTFGYDPATPVLHQINLAIDPGETVALVGPTGAGKSSLISLVPRLYDPWQGRVLVNGVNIRECQLSSLRSQIALVLQDPFLLPLSIADNIAYGRLNAHRDEIVNAARTANCHNFITALPHGYDTVIGERGATLSGGEKQRISIARALLKDAPILILDEPTSALDAATEQQLMEAMDRLMNGRTSIIIAHRLSTIRRADRIACLHNGRLVETGSHEELLRQAGFYAGLFSPTHQEVTA